MIIEILHIEDCTNWAETGARTRTALDALGLADAGVDYRLIATGADAAKAPFAGSPTILIDGTDAFPSGGRIADLACRIYQTGHGLAGLPSTAQITAAIEGRIREGRARRDAPSGSQEPAA